MMAGGGFDVAVIGVGAMGAATCAALARRGARVLGLDAGSIPNCESSHHGRSRVFRVAYFEHPAYVPLLQASRRAWRSLGERAGRPLLHECGVLYIGPRGGALVDRTAESAASHGIPHQPLSADELALRHPQFRPPSGCEAVFEPQAGWVGAEAGVEALAAEALGHGARLHAGEPVVSWAESPDGVTIQTTADSYRADKLVITAGPAAGSLLPDLAAGLRITRQVLAWVWPSRPERFDGASFPVWAMQTSMGIAYGFPRGADAIGIKLALHEQGPELGAGERPGPAAPEELEPLLQILASHIPDAAGPCIASAACRYTNSPDGQFIIDRLPGHERVVFAAGFSGHGFKFAPVVGEALADLVERGQSRFDIRFLGLDRFRAAQL